MGLEYGSRKDEAKLTWEREAGGNRFKKRNLRGVNGRVEREGNMGTLMGLASQMQKKEKSLDGGGTKEVRTCPEGGHEKKRGVSRTQHETTEETSQLRPGGGGETGVINKKRTKNSKGEGSTKQTGRRQGAEKGTRSQSSQTREVTRVKKPCTR